MKNSLGNIFKITSFGESHGPGVGVVIDGCPAGIKLDLGQIQLDLDRRKPGQSALTTARKEDEDFETYEMRQKAKEAEEEQLRK